MKKNNREINIFDISSVVNRDSRANKIKTTNINILLNKVRLEKKKEVKKKFFLIFLLVIMISVVSFFSLI